MLETLACMDARRDFGLNTGVIIEQQNMRLKQEDASNGSLPSTILPHQQRSHYHRRRNHQTNHHHHHHRSKSTPEERTTKPMLDDQLAAFGVTGFEERMSSSRSSSGQFDRQRTAAKQAIEKSPFSRSQSTVFYASNVMWDSKVDDGVHSRSPRSEKHSSPLIDGNDQLNNSGQFRRSVHRSNTSYKSQDSGFSDAAEVIAVNVASAVTDSDVPIMTTTVTSGNLPKTREQTPKLSAPPSLNSNNVHISPVNKLTKWSSSARSPLKMFWKQQDGSSKVSVLKCCAGMSPFFSFYHHKQIRSSSEVEPDEQPAGDVHVHCSPPGLKHDKTPSKSVTDLVRSESNGENTGTWPRVRKAAHNRQQDAESLLPASSSIPKGVYYSTRVKGNQKPRNIFKGNSNQQHLHDNEQLEPKNNFRNTLFVCNSAVQLWLRDMHWSTEDECMNTLQSKAVARDLADVSVIAARNSKDAIVLLRRLSYTMTTELKRLKKNVDTSQYKSSLVDCDSISLMARCLLRDARSFQFKEVPAVQRHLRLVFAHCSILKQLLDRLRRAELTLDNAPSPLDVHFALELAFENLFDALVLCHLKNIVDILEEPPSLRSLKTAVTCVGSLGTLDSNLCHLIAKTGSIRSLLTVCIESRYVSIRAVVLRSLATLCCIEESIRDLEESGGVDCITDILAENNASEFEKCEAAGVIAQITSPHLDNSANVSGLVENIPSLIRSLTDLAKFTKSHDGFLLSTAAIGNLTFLASQACHHLVECDTVSVLVSAFLRKDRSITEKVSESIFVKDQVATILANMAGVPEGRGDIIRSGGLVLLLCFMQMRPSTVQSATETAACERIQQKSAIALSRLCSDVKIAQQVVALQGVNRLVRLCKDERERNHSDAVLVACLAVLRKIATACGLEEFKELGATELVEPRLLDSFLIYSSRQESYV